MPLIFLHGFLGHPKDWEAVQSELGFATLALTLPGHLQEPMVEDIVKSIHIQLPKGPHLLVGYSAGGRIALALKARFPSCYSQVIALSAHPGLKQRKARRKEDLFWIEKFKTDPLEKVVADWYTQPLFHGLFIPWERRLCHDPKQLALFLERFGQGVIHPPKLFSNTIFAYGERDLKYKTLYTTLPGNVQVEVIASASHALHLENPHGCANLIRGVINEHTTIPI